MSTLDKLSIDTPEQVALDFSLATIGSRFLAVAIDTLVQLGATGILLILALFGSLVSAFTVDIRSWVFGVLLLAWFVVYYAYFAIFEAAWNGQTPGKRLIGLRVISVSGRPISVYEAIIRNVVRIADQMPGIYAVGIITVFISERSQRLGDLAAATVVVHERPVEAGSIDTGAETIFVARTSHGAARLTPEEIAVVNLFLRRRSDLADHERLRAARRIAERIRPRLRVPAGVEDEQLLEEVAAEYLAGSRYR